MTRTNINSLFNKKRLHRINFLMKEINDSTDCIYEALVDRQIVELKRSIDKLKTVISDIEDSLKDEI